VTSEDHGLSRRAALGLLGATAVGAAGAGYGLRAAGAGADSPESSVHSFYGRHQAGIVTPVQKHLYFASFDLTSSATRDDLKTLLSDWTEAAAEMVAGEEVGETGATDGGPHLPPEDTGEALDLGAQSLTVTVGLGPSLFDDRFGLADQRPEQLKPLPSFAFDLLEEEISGGDLCLQACADDPQVAVHAIRNLTRIGFGRAQIRWAQLGYGRTSSTSRKQTTPRNLFGFKDGTANIMAEQDDALDEWVWAGDEAPAWLRGGSYLVTRKIAMLIESWDRQRLEEQEQIFGRDKLEGAPLSGGEEFDDADFAMKNTDADLVIPSTAHVRLAHPDHNDGVRLLRRGYNYVDGNNELGQINGGLFFMTYQRDPANFATVQRSLADDALNEYIRHIGSAVFAIPPGVKPGQSWAHGLFD